MKEKNCRKVKLFVCPEFRLENGLIRHDSTLTFRFSPEFIPENEIFPILRNRQSSI